MFSGAGYDPQDVKVIFDPVTYVIFHGMSGNNLEEIVLMANPPEDGATELSTNRLANRSRTGISSLRLCTWTMKAASLLDKGHVIADGNKMHRLPAAHIRHLRSLASSRPCVRGPAARRGMAK